MFFFCCLAYVFTILILNLQGSGNHVFLGVVWAKTEQKGLIYDLRAMLPTHSYQIFAKMPPSKTVICEKFAMFC